MPEQQIINSAKSFFGWRVVTAAFVLATFGWGLGFYGPPIYLHAVRETRGWSIALISAAVTVHYLFGAIVVANLPRLHRKFGLTLVTKAGVLALAVGLWGWSAAVEPWQLFLATLLSGGGWVTMGAAAINAIVSPWFMAQRPKALSTAYNGASVGGIIFSPLWVALIAAYGFAVATLVIGGLCVIIVWFLADRVFSQTPDMRGQEPDGGLPGTQAGPSAISAAQPLPGKLLWANWRFRTLATGMALGLFAQIGLLAHLFSVIIPTLGSQAAGLAMGMATAAAIAGRTAFGWLMPAHADRRLAACLSYSIQIVGCLILLLSGGASVALILTGILLFGFGIGNATSLPPLIAQAEFAKDDTSRVVALIVAMGQATYAFAPALFGLFRVWPDFPGGGLLSGSGPIFALAALIKTVAIICFLAGRRG